MAPSLQQAETIRRQRTTQGAGFVLLALAVCFGGYSLATGQWIDAAGNGAAVPLITALIVAARRGHVLFAAYAISLLGTAGIVVAALLRGNPGNASFYLVLGVMLSPMILPTRHVLVMVVVGLTGEAVLALFPAEIQEVRPLIGVTAEGAFLCALAGALALATSVSGKRLLDELAERSAAAQLAGERADALALKLEASERMEALGLLAGGVAHDFNNLLTVMRGCASMLEEQIKPGGQAQDDLRDIVMAVDRGTALTGQLLAFSRRDVVRTEVLDLYGVAESMRDLLQRLVGKDVRMMLEAGSGPWPVTASSSQIEQVLMNLAVNARDAMSGQGELSLRVDRDEDAQLGPVCRLIVSDTGAGMSDAVKARIFEPFFTTKAPGKGTGLGLSTVYGVIAQLGGRIDVESTIGRGTTFSVILPRSNGEAGTVASEARASLPRADPRSACIIDDEPSVRALMARLIGSSGVMVHAFDSAEAMLAESQLTFDVVVTDINLRGMSGIELAEQLHTRQPGVRVVLVSGYTADPRAIARLVGQGATFLAKPFKPDALLAAVALPPADVEASGTKLPVAGTDLQ